MKIKLYQLNNTSFKNVVNCYLFKPVVFILMPFNVDEVILPKRDEDDIKNKNRYHEQHFSIKNPGTKSSKNEFIGIKA